jgi:hypothetical protein
MVRRDTVGSSSENHETMNYLQRFSLALASLRSRKCDSDCIGAARRLADSSPDEWLSQIHRIARELPPRRPPARGVLRRGPR